MTTRTNKMPKKDSATILRKQLDAAIAENVATKVENVALQKDLEDTQTIAKRLQQSVDSLKQQCDLEKREVDFRGESIESLRSRLQFSVTTDVITNEPNRVLRLAYCVKNDHYHIISDRCGGCVTLSMDELRRLYNLLHVSGHSA